MASEFYPLFLRVLHLPSVWQGHAWRLHHETQLRSRPVPSTRTHKRPTTCPCPASHLSWAHVVTKCVSSLSNSPARKGREFEVSSLKMHPLPVFSSRLQPQQHNKPPQTSCNHHSHLLQLLTVANNTSTADSNLSTFKGRTPENAKGDPTFATGFAKVPTLQGSFPCSHATARSHKPQDELSSRHGQQRHVVQLLSPGTAEIDMASLNGTKKNKKQEQR